VVASRNLLGLMPAIPRLAIAAGSVLWLLATQAARSVAVIRLSAIGARGRLVDRCHLLPEGASFACPWLCLGSLAVASPGDLKEAWVTSTDVVY